MAIGQTFDTNKSYVDICDEEQNYMHMLSSAPTPSTIHNTHSARIKRVYQQ